VGPFHIRKPISRAYLGMTSDSVGCGSHFSFGCYSTDDEAGRYFRFLLTYDKNRMSDQEIKDFSSMLEKACRKITLETKVSDSIHILT